MQKMTNLVIVMYLECREFMAIQYNQDEVGISICEHIWGSLFNYKIIVSEGAHEFLNFIK